MNGHDNVCEGHKHFVKAHYNRFVCKKIAHYHLYRCIDCWEYAFDNLIYV